MHHTNNFNSRLRFAFRVIFSLLLALTSSLSVTADKAIAQQQLVAVKVKIDSFGWLPGLGFEPGFYSLISINGSVSRSETIRCLDQDVICNYSPPFTYTIFPYWWGNWSVDKAIDPALGTVDIVISLFEDIPTGGVVNEIDIHPSVLRRNIVVTLNLATGQLTIPSEPSPGGPEPDITVSNNTVLSLVNGGNGGIKFIVTASPSQGGGDSDVDTDGDGLMDAWETRGLDINADGIIDLNLPAMGANPNHKDLFLELDIVDGEAPGRDDIQAMKLAFAAAPVSNPDGQSGINLWVDTGNIVDPTVREGDVLGTCIDGINNGVGLGTDATDRDCVFIVGAGGQHLETSIEDPLGPPNCNDQMDNDGDGNTDANDPECLLGDNLGGGNIIAVANAPTGCLGGNFYTVKGNNFAQDIRETVFRYGISSNDVFSNCGGGQAEVGGNDFIEFNHDGGTIMHEFGHNLNLRHGGSQEHNCKPNYVSVMNYDNQMGIRRVGGGAILDYSPPRRAFNGATRGIVPTLVLREDNLDEASILDATDAENLFVFRNFNNLKLTNRLDQPVDWNGNGITTESGLTVNIDSAGINSIGQLGPGACANTNQNSSLSSFDDWTRVVEALPLWQFPDSRSDAINPTTEPEMTLDELLQLEEQLNTTDLSISITDSADPAIAGRLLDFTMNINNSGPGQAELSQVVINLPSGVTYIGNSGDCMASPTNTITCNVSRIGAGETKQVLITTRIDADLVYNAGGPTRIRTKVSIDNLAGLDLNTDNNQATERTQIVAAADLAVVSLVPINPPAQILVGQPFKINFQNKITNNGPSAPMDAVVTAATTSAPDATITPLVFNVEVLAVGLGENRPIEEKFSLQCNDYGNHSFGFTNQIQPASPEDTDLNLANNQADLTLDIECVVPVAIRINRSRIRLDENRTITVTVRKNAVGQFDLPLAFDPATIDPTSVRFGPRDLIWSDTGGAVEIHNQGHNKNRRWHFSVSETGLSVKDTEACIKGTWIDPAGNPQTFFGCTEVQILPQPVDDPGDK